MKDIPKRPTDNSGGQTRNQCGCEGYRHNATFRIRGEAHPEGIQAWLYVQTPMHLGPASAAALMRLQGCAVLPVTRSVLLAVLNKLTPSRAALV